MRKSRLRRGKHRRICTFSCIRSDFTLGEGNIGELSLQGENAKAAQKVYFEFRFCWPLPHRGIASVNDEVSRHTWTFLLSIALPGTCFHSSPAAVKLSLAQSSNLRFCFPFSFKQLLILCIFHLIPWCPHLWLWCFMFRSPSGCQPPQSRPS